ncbi:MAG: peptidoglycan-binding domain-containing protein, partial [Pseudomonadota bacterium]
EFIPPLDEAKDAGTVARVQTRLHAEGFLDRPADGRLDRATRRAIAAFQADRGLVVTGWVSPVLLEAIDAPKAAPAAPSATSDTAAAVRPWSLSALTGMGVHSAAGDLLGSVDDVLLRDRCAVAVIVRSGGTPYPTPLPWAAMGERSGLPRVVVAASAAEARALLNADPADLAAWRASRLLGGAAMRGDARVGVVTDLEIAADGTILGYRVRTPDGEITAPAGPVPLPDQAEDAPVVLLP